MIPPGNLGRHQMKKLKLYAAAQHPHAAQQPEPMKLAVG
jgi:large subunit ribosomal protein L13